MSTGHFPLQGENKIDKSFPDISPGKPRRSRAKWQGEKKYVFTLYFQLYNFTNFMNFIT